MATQDGQDSRTQQAGLASSSEAPGHGPASRQGRAGRPRDEDPCRRPGRRRALAVLAVSAAVAMASACSAEDGSPVAAASGSAVAADATAFDAATRGDAAFNEQFSHEFADVDDVRMHYVTGGSGPPLVLLAGWPQSWFAWRDVLPALAERHTVYAVDLPGLGDSQGSPSGHDKATLARYVHGLVAEELGLRDIGLVGHDLGAGVGFQYASQFPQDVSRYAHLDYPLPGPALSAEQFRTFSWHLALHSQEAIPEAVVDDDVREYLSLFFPQVAFGGVTFGGPGAESPFSEAELDEFARTYQRPQVLTGGFELYRRLDQDERDNIAAAPVRAPTLLMTAEGTLASTRPTLELLVTDLVRAVEVPRSGHWLMEENPDFVTAQLLGFLAG